MTKQAVRALALCSLVALPCIALPLARSLDAMPATLQGGRKQVATLIKEADRKPVAEAWSIVQKIQDLTDGSLSEDTVIKGLIAAADQAGTVGRLVAARSLLDLDEDGAYGKKAVELVQDVLLGQGKLEERMAASQILGDANLRTSAKIAARKLLEKVVNDDTANQRLRLSAARSLFTAGNTRLSRSVLLEFLKSQDRHLKIEGALALAEIGDMINARQVLETIENDPTDEGRLAKSYLEYDRQAHFFDLAIKELNAKLLNREYVEEAKRGDHKDKLRLLRNLMKMVKRLHMEGDKIDDNELIENAAKGMMRSMDRFSSYLTSDEYARFAFDLNRDYGGIGAYVNVKNGYFQITRPIYSGPAYRKGLLSNDRILEVDGWSTTDQPLDEIIRRLKGKPGTEVTIKVWRFGWPEPKDFTLQRAEIQLPSVNWQMLPGKIGYLELITFGLHTGHELRSAIDKLKANGARGLVMDLRNNTGGYLSQAFAVAESFLPKNSLVVYTKSRTEPEEKFTSRLTNYCKLPLVVLVNENSASASEIVAGALQDHKRARIVGQQSYGKGSVQHLRVIPGKTGEPFQDENHDGRREEWEKYDDLNKNNKFDPGPRARITIAYYYLPSGRCLHKIIDKHGKVKNPDYGVIPDRKVEGFTLKTKDLWKNAVINELWQSNKMQDYVDKLLKDKSKRELLVHLAEGDRGSWKDYPGFEEFYKSLDTQLTKDDIRRWVRIVIREKVADLRGNAWPGGRLIGDYEEDRQLQAGIDEVLKNFNEKITDIPDYVPTLKLEPEKKAKPKGEKVGKSKER